MYKPSNRRDFDRIVFAEPVHTTIELITPYEDMPSKEVQSVVVLDMSAGGLKFVSKIEFMVNYLAIYKMKVRVDNRDILVYGKIIRKRKLPHGFFEYGLRFDFEYKEAKKIRIKYD